MVVEAVRCEPVSGPRKFPLRQEITGISCHLPDSSSPDRPISKPTQKLMGEFPLSSSREFAVRNRERLDKDQDVISAYACALWTCS